MQERGVRLPNLVTTRDRRTTAGDWGKNIVLPLGMLLEKTGDDPASRNRLIGALVAHGVAEARAGRRPDTEERP